MDNLNTHSIASLYQTFEPKHALELAGRLEIHFTPKHGSWLNITEIELYVMTRQCLGIVLIALICFRRNLLHGEKSEIPTKRQ